MWFSNFIELTLPHGCFFVNLPHISRTPFYKAPLAECFCTYRYISKTDIIQFNHPNRYDFWYYFLSAFVVSSYPEVPCKKGVLKNFAKFTGKQLRQGLSLRPATLLKKRLWHKCFAVNFVKFLKTPISVEHLRWLLLFCLTLCNSAKGEELH